MDPMENSQPAPHVTLVKPERGAKGYEPGDRIILVNGERWGRTYVDRHGMHGTSYTFVQDGGEVIMVPYDPPSPGGRMHAVTVRISTARAHKRGQGDTRPTDVQLQECVQGLVDTGKLIDPKIYKAGVEQRRQAFEENERRGKAERRTAWATKVREVVSKSSWTVDTQVDALVDLMEWAQSQ